MAILLTPKRVTPENLTWEDYIALRTKLELKEYESQHYQKAYRKLRESRPPARD